MPKIVVSEPHLVSGLLDNNRRSKIVLSMNISGNITDTGLWTILVDLICRSVGYSVIGTKKKYLIGCEGAMIKVNVSLATVEQIIPEKAMPVTYNNAMTISDGSENTISPSVKTKEVETSIGQIKQTSGRSKTTGNTYTYNEFPITVIKDDNEIEWRVDLPRGDKAVRDYLLGNFYFFAAIKWERDKKKGTISIEPNELYFYNKKNKKIDSMRTMLMRLALYVQENKKILFPRGLSFEFEIKD